MSPSAEPRLRLTVLDRLIDEAPRDRVADTAGWEASPAEMRVRLRRDVEWLLNARRIVEPAAERYVEVNHSLYHYGLPDLSSMPDTDEARSHLAHSVEECLNLFEPRLMSVRVTPAEVHEATGRSLHLTIEALLRMDPAPERVVFDTVIESGSGKVIVTGEEDA